MVLTEKPVCIGIDTLKLNGSLLARRRAGGLASMSTSSTTVR